MTEGVLEFKTLKSKAATTAVAVNKSKRNVKRRPYSKNTVEDCGQYFNGLK